MLPSRYVIGWRSLNCYLIGWDRHLASINLKTDLIEIIKKHTCWGRKRLSSKSFLTFFLENETFYCELSFSVNYLFRLIDEMTPLYLFQILKLTFDALMIFCYLIISPTRPFSARSSNHSVVLLLSINDSSVEKYCIAAVTVPDTNIMNPII